MKEFDESTDTLEILQWAWSELVRGVEQIRHPFHCPVLGSVADGTPSLRTVVLRVADPDQRLLVCHTDMRSPKVEQLQINPAVQWLFYDSGQRTQIRISGTTTLHHQDDIARERWNASTTRSQSCYYVPLGPGAPVPEGYVAEPLPEGFENFAAVYTAVESIEWLFLRGSGHLRYRFSWTGDDWAVERIAP